MYRRRQLVSLLIASITILTISLTPVFAEKNQSQFNYLALGDSLAHGTQYDGSHGDGYADLIAKQLDELGMLEYFSKDFAKPGHTAAGVLADIKENKEVKGVALQDLIASADIITISAGVNDILRLIDLDTFSIDQAEIEEGLKGVKQNIEEIVKTINTMNANADIYVMGYYNAFPYLPADIQENIIIPTLSLLNDHIKQASEATGATYVRTDKAIAKDFETYLPHQEDIHPGKEGYLLLANCFWKEMDLGQEIGFTDDIPDWAEDEVNHLVAKGLIKGYEDGSFRAQSKVSRLHATYMINRAVIFEYSEGPNPGYQDLTEDSEGFDVVAKLSKNGVLEGDNDHNFKPDDLLTRAQAAKMIVKAFQLKGESNTGFSDVEGHWAEKYIQILSAHGAIGGYPDHTFRPDQTITRAEFAKIVSFIINS